MGLQALGDLRELLEPGEVKQVSLKHKLMLMWQLGFLGNPNVRRGKCGCHTHSH